MIQVGPDLSSDITFNFLSGFRQSLEQKLNCPVKIIGSPSFESFYASILKHNSNIYIIADHYGQALEKEGYRAVLSRSTATKMLLLSTNADLASAIRNGEQFTAYAPDQYTITYMVIEKWLDSTQTKPLVKFKFGHNYTTSIMDLIRKPNIIIATPNGFIERLPEAFQSNLYIIDVNVDIGANFIIADTAPPTLRKAIIDAWPDLYMADNWIPTDQFTHSPYSDYFSKITDKLKQNLENR